MQIRYTDSPVSIYPNQLQGFFVGWSNPPSLEKHHEVLRKSDYCILAIDEKEEKVIGFITAITDHVLTAYISLLEVLPEYQGHGIGAELVQRLLEKLHGIYTVDMLCDPELIPYFESTGMKRAEGVVIRNEKRQSGL
ncbi:GNAT family N-acetyltransferase [Ktedonobacteria bacterium brp13]|nr:GNAT family N-acetyltransferase [Ktedonobacteria bacterium brp13]